MIFKTKPMDLLVMASEIDPTEQERKLKEAKELLIADGWVSLSTECSEDYYLVYTADGTFGIYWLEWDSDYSDWTWQTTYYPVFWKFKPHLSYKDNDYYKYMDEMVTQGPGWILVAKTLPQLTENSLKAHKLMGEYWSLECGDAEEEVVV